MNHRAFARAFLCMLNLLCGGAIAGAGQVRADETPSVVKSITILAPRDVGFFAGDLVDADVELVVAPGAVMDLASLPHPGPIDYWLDLRSIDVEKSTEGPNWRYRLKLLYQNFYDALDARRQEIPAFSVAFTRGGTTESAQVQAWTIGVSPLREVAPPVKEDPKDYMRADQAAPLIKVVPLWRAAALAAFAAALGLTALAYDRVWWPFRASKARPFGDAARRLRRLREKRGADEGYLEALRILHRGIDQTDGRSVLADDAAAFLRRHPVFAPMGDSLARFFAASREAFFRSAPERSRSDLPFDALETFARKMAAAERTRP
jgi:mxaA protein